MAEENAGAATDPNSIVGNAIEDVASSLKAKLLKLVGEISALDREIADAQLIDTSFASYPRQRVAAAMEVLKPWIEQLKYSDDIAEKRQLVALDRAIEAASAELVEAKSVTVRFIATTLLKTLQKLALSVGGGKAISGYPIDFDMEKYLEVVSNISKEAHGKFFSDDVVLRLYSQYADSVFGKDKDRLPKIYQFALGRGFVVNLRTPRFVAIGIAIIFGVGAIYLLTIAVLANYRLG